MAFLIDFDERSAKFVGMFINDPGYCESVDCLDQAIIANGNIIEGIEAKA